MGGKWRNTQTLPCLEHLVQVPISTYSVLCSEKNAQVCFPVCGCPPISMLPSNVGWAASFSSLEIL